MDLEKHHLAVELVPVERVFCSPSNPRQNETAVPHVLSSLRRFGWQQPIVARESGEVIAGNTRLKAAMQLGMTEVPVVWFSGSETDAVAFKIADNRTHEFAEWDQVGLASILELLRAEDALEGVGFDDTQIDELLAEIAATSKHVSDPGPCELPVEATMRVGDLWLLGDHRLLCGDSTSPEAMASLMGEELAHLLATDPPYLVDYKGSGANSQDAGTRPPSGEHWDDYKGEVDGLALFSRLLEVALAHCHERAPAYQWHAHRRQALVEQAWEENGLLMHQQIIWTKSRGTLGRSHYMWAHEPAFYGWKKGKMPVKSRRPPLNETTVWEIDQAGEQAENHPTQKPLEIFLKPMEWHSKPGEVVLEPFSGSGSQIIAAEQLGRKCFAMELDPRFVDAAVRRWELATGLTAVLEGSDQTMDQIQAERTEGDYVG